MSRGGCSAVTAWSDPAITAWRHPATSRVRGRGIYPGWEPMARGGCSVRTRLVAPPVTRNGDIQESQELLLSCGVPSGVGYPGCIHSRLA
eukprot:1195829-Prorocentrum_minimum.AAC.6